MIDFYIFLFILGTIVGSFLNVVIIRLKTRESILNSRSHCISCKKELRWYELIPLVSFLIQKGRCRSCKRRISWQYPLVELFTGLIFLLIGVYFFDLTGFGIINAFFLLIVASFLIIIFVYDLKHYIILDKIIYPAIVLTFLYNFQFSIFNFQSIFNSLIFNYLLAGLIGGAFFLIIVLISKGRWMGVGDIKLGVLMGILLGISHLLVALFLAFLIGAIIAIVLLGLKKKELKSEIPFGPFLVTATFIALFWGDILIRWYFEIFHIL